MSIVCCKWEPLFVGELLARGADLIVVLDDYDAEHQVIDPALLKRIRRIYQVSHFDSVDELSSVACDIKLSGYVVDRVVSVHEFSQYGAGVLASLLRPKNFSLDTAVSTRDKRLMKALARADGIETARFVSVSDPRDPGQRRRAVEELGFPMVLKPVNGFGASATARVESEAELHSFLDGLHYKSPLLHSRQLCAEEYVEGEEYHVDAVWRGPEEALLFSVGRYFVPPLSVLQGRHFYGSRLLPPTTNGVLYQRLLEMNRRLNFRLGIREGPTHLEVFRRPDGRLVFSEIASRFGGGAIPEAVREAYGQDIRSAWAAQVMGATPILAPGPHPVVGWFNITPERAGAIVSVPGEERIRSLRSVLYHEYVLKVGDRFEQSAASTWCLLLVLGAQTEGAFDAAVTEASTALRIGVADEPAVRA